MLTKDISFYLSFKRKKVAWLSTEKDSEERKKIEKKKMSRKNVWPQRMNDL